MYWWIDWGPRNVSKKRSTSNYKTTLSLSFSFVVVTGFCGKRGHVLHIQWVVTLARALRYFIKDTRFDGILAVGFCVWFFGFLFFCFGCGGGSVSVSLWPYDCVVVLYWISGVYRCCWYMVGLRWFLKK